MDNSDVYMKCPICNLDKVNEKYSGPIRSAEPGSEYVKGFSVKVCQSCKIEFLEPFPKAVNDAYREGDYWNVRTNNLNEKQFVNKHIREQLIWLNKIGPGEFTGETVLDIGCGHGLFLNLIKGLAKQTAGLDIDVTLKNHLEANGHQFYDDWPDKRSEIFSRIVLFDTLEHIKDPIKYLKKAKEYLSESGKIIIGVPNAEDFMTNVVEVYKPFFYRKGHLYYFNMRSLTKCLEVAGYSVLDRIYVHKYNLMNLLGWIEKKSPQGVPESFFDEITETSFIQNVEREGKSSHILIMAEVKN